ncbi:CdaR family protein [Weissella koreensis]|uniref:Uncharacterized protein n=1 Tax=Weissella koreensis TaxID=165096 RepID=A0A7H1MKX1_9LACO|nr:CdaR family protein [Weissella koreensis]AEJ23264.1 hypothetical protein WKK_01950 [Weissella koreensis KACC 15510]AVH74905.1 hypothetical protein C4597_02245 [Weissella koreensis]EJF33865.1 hypothetical protein JC2156_06790 [Weissella koreensis KCTC 3621]MCZ9310769.1 CdaR family protein [Weissella koreensis]QGN20128.1 hypothetical protein GKC51_02220 [Weissella koreensis]
MFKMTFSKIVYLILSLLMAVLLAIYVDGTTLSRSSAVQKQNSTGLVGLGLQKTDTSTMPIQISGISTDNYIVTGLPETVDVKITGPSALVTAAMNTKNFQVYANLKGLSEGSHQISLNVSGLNHELTYKLNEKTFNINIAKRATQNFKVQTVYNKEAIADGYQVGDVTSSVTTAQIVGSQTAVASVNRVVASVQLNRNTKESTNKEVALQAVDVNGNAVNVTISPATAVVSIPVKAGTGTKDVPIKIETKNGDASQFDITADINSLKLSGDAEKLAEVSSLTATVDLSNVVQNSQQTIDLDIPEGVTADHKSVQVKIEAKQ